ncbi:MAG: hypothetical protein ACRDMV_13705 [Streptosporangiales bacterium]
MAEITIYPERLRPVVNSCESVVAPQVEVAKRSFTVDEGTAGAGLSVLESAAPARACVSAWRQAFGDGSNAMRALSAKLEGTAAAVMDTDADAAELYEGPVAALPTIDFTLNLEK